MKILISGMVVVEAGVILCTFNVIIANITVFYSVVQNYTPLITKLVLGPKLPFWHENFVPQRVCPRFLRSGKCLLVFIYNK